MRRFKKVLILSVVPVLLMLVSFISVVKAQDQQQQGQQFTNTWYDPSFEQFAAKVFDPRNPGEIFGERYTYAQVNWIINSLRAFGYGPQLSACVAAQGTGAGNDALTCIANLAIPEPQNQSGNSQQTGYKDNGAILGMATIGDALLNFHAASGVNYVATTAANFHIIPEAKAQGFGYGTLTPIQDLWKVMRNISFILLTIFFIATAFMVMFRVKISPQASVTIQSAIPKMIVTLIIIVFSYAIAGFIIDLAFVLTGVVALFIKSAQPGITAYDLPTFFNTIRGVVNPIFSIFLGLLASSIVPSIILGAIAGSVTAGFGIPFAIGLVFIIFGIALIVFAFRIVWLLLITAIKIVLLTIFAPVILLTNMLPNANTLGTWIKNLAASASVYPVVILMLLLAHFFFWKMFLIPTSPDIAKALDSFDTYNLNDSSLAVPIAGYVALPGFEGTTQLVGLLLAFGILGLIPSAANLIQSVVSGRSFDAAGAMKGNILGSFGLGYSLGQARLASRSAKVEEARSKAAAAAGVTYTPSGMTSILRTLRMIK